MAENAQKKNKFVVVLIIVLVVALAAAGIVIWQLASKKEGSGESGLNYTSENGIGYDINAQVLTTGDIAVSQPEGIAVRFEPIARSSDGINFTCKIGNSLANSLDMYIDIYADFEGDDEVYLSGLLRPGEGITSFKTTHEMPKGTYDVLLVLTLVEDDHKTLHSQTNVVLTLSVG